MRIAKVVRIHALTIANLSHFVFRWKLLGSTLKRLGIVNNTGLSSESLCCKEPSLRVQRYNKNPNNQKTIEFSDKTMDFSEFCHFYATFIRTTIHYSLQINCIRTNLICSVLHLIHRYLLLFFYDYIFIVLQHFNKAFFFTLRNNNFGKIYTLIESPIPDFCNRMR